MSDKWRKVYLIAISLQAMLGSIVMLLAGLVFILNLFLQLLSLEDTILLLCISFLVGFFANLPLLRETGILERLLRNVV